MYKNAYNLKPESQFYNIHQQAIPQVINRKSPIIYIARGVVKKVAPGSVPEWMLVGFISQEETATRKIAATAPTAFELRERLKRRDNGSSRQFGSSALSNCHRRLKNY